jgi:hypothetical protein
MMVLVLLKWSHCPLWPLWWGHTALDHCALSGNTSDRGSGWQVCDMTDYSHVAAAAQCNLHQTMFVWGNIVLGDKLLTATSALETKWYIHTRYSTIKRTNYWSMPQPWIDLKETVLSNITHLKRLHNVWPHLYNILDMVTLVVRDEGRWQQGVVLARKV